MNAPCRGSDDAAITSTKVRTQGKPRSALDEIGFKPLGRRVKIKAGINQSLWSATNV